MVGTDPKLRDFFSNAVQCKTSEEQAAYLEQVCQGNAELRARLDELLQAHREAGSFLQEPSPAPTQTVDAPRVSERLGTMIGPYKLLQQIGEGGMGTVFMAEQTEPIQRKVALKVIKPGMDSRQVIARFEAERQALAMMDHVNIARVFDGGTTENGRPYFVMELVHGVPITKYCDDNHLTPRERLELFVSVCQAIQHAHQKGIIHRDIKPSNVMVTLYDGKPVPKVIDFGVAKATEQKLTERTLFTQHGTMVGTLEYMSPEQAEMSALGVDTRSDIYSLGVLLYELLTGNTPLTHKRMKEEVYAEILRMIKDVEPPKPSTRLSDSGEALASISANRHMEPAKLSKLMRGELDWIVMKTLEKDRNRRYETANGFAADVQRYLADEAVLACPPSAGYRLRKFARRNRSVLAVAGLVLFFLVLLGSVAGWAWRDQAARAWEAELERTARATEQANHLERAVERAELLQREGRRGEALAALERAQLLAREAEPTPPLAERIGSLQQLLDAEGRDEVLVAQFEAILREVQTEYVDIERGSFSSKKGYPKIREALEQYGIAVGVTPPAAAVSHIQKRPAPVQAVVVAALNECMRFVPRKDSGTRQWLVDVLQKADSDPWRNKVRQAWSQPATLEALLKDIDVRQQPPGFLVVAANALPIESPSRLDLARRVQFAYPGDFWANHELGWVLARGEKSAEAIRYYTAALALRPDNPGVLLNRANTLRDAGELEAAVADLQRAIALAPRYAFAYNNLGNALNSQKKLPEAIDSYRKAIELDPNSARYYSNLGNVLREQKKLDEAMAAYKNAIELDPNYSDAYKNLGNVLREQKKLDEAIAAYRQAIELNSNNVGAYAGLGIVLHDQKKLDEAIDAYKKAIEIDPKNARTHTNLGNTLSDQKKVDEAIAYYRKAIEIDPKYAYAYTNLGLALYGQKKVDEAIAAYRKAIDLDPKLAAVYFNLGNALHEQKKWDDAVVAYRKAIELDPKDARTYYNLGNVLYGQKKLDDAIDAYRKAVELDPKFASAYSNLGAALYEQKKLPEAIAAYRKAIELNPKNAHYYNSLGLVLLEQKKLPEAIDAYRKAIELNPKNASAYSDIGLALRHQRKLPEAIESFRKAIELNPKLASAYNNLGVILWDQKKPPEAIAAYRKAIEIDPKYAAAYSNLGALLCDSLKEYDKAIECFRKAIDLDPNIASHHFNLGNALRHQQKLPEAIAAYRKSIELDPNSVTAWQSLGWLQYRIGDWQASIDALEKSCKLQGGTGDAGQWIVLALAHAKLAAKEGLPEKERAHHQAEARRRYEQADKQIDSWWRLRPGQVDQQAIWDFRAEARELMKKESGLRNQESEKRPK